MHRCRINPEIFRIVGIQEVGTCLLRYVSRRCATYDLFSYSIEDKRPTSPDWADLGSRY